MQLHTHLQIDQTLNGKVLQLRKGYAKIALETSPIMIVDDEGLIHGGFIFGGADFCAMAAVNDPLVVLAKSEVKFKAPVKLGETVLFEGDITAQEGKRATVEVIGKVEEKEVFQGLFMTAILDKHPLS